MEDRKLQQLNLLPGVVDDELTKKASLLWHQLYNKKPDTISAILNISTKELYDMLVEKKIISRGEYEERIKSDPFDGKTKCRRCGIKIFEKDKIPQKTHSVKKGRQRARKRPIYLEKNHLNNQGFCPDCFTNSQKDPEHQQVSWENLMSSAGWRRTLLPNMWERDGVLFDENEKMNAPLLPYKTLGEYHRTTMTVP